MLTTLFYVVIKELLNKRIAALFLLLCFNIITTDNSNFYIVAFMKVHLRHIQVFLNSFNCGFNVFATNILIFLFILDLVIKSKEPNALSTKSPLLLVPIAFTLSEK
jgi:hypothetical protein